MRGCDADMETSTPPSSLLPSIIYHSPPLSVIVSKVITAAQCCSAAELRAASCILHAVQILINKRGLTDTNYHTERIIYEAETEIVPTSESVRRETGLVWSVVSKISNFPLATFWVCREEINAFVKEM